MTQISHTAEIVLGALYLSLWVWAAGSSKARPPLTGAFLATTCFLVGAGLVTWCATAQIEIIYPVIAGAAVFVATSILYRAEISLVAWATVTLMWAIAGDAPTGTVTMIIVVYSACYLLSCKPVVFLFGSGSVLFSMVLSAVLATSAAFFANVHSTSLAVSVGFLSLATLLATGVAIYPFPLVGKLLWVTGAGLLLVLATASLGPQTTGLSISCALVGLALCVFTIFWQRAAPALGPHFSHYRKVHVLGPVAFGLIVLILTINADSASVPTLNALGFTVVGYAGSVAVSAAGFALAASWQPLDSTNWRMVFVDLGGVVMLAGGGAAFLATSPTLHSAFAAVVPAVASVTQVLPDCSAAHEAFVAATGPWGVHAISVVLLRVLASYLHFVLGATTPLWAPFFAKAVFRGSPRTRRAAITFNHLPEDAELAELLEYLAAPESKGQITVFITSAEARARPAAVKSLVEAGHEVGLLMSFVTLRPWKPLDEAVLAEAAAVEAVTGKPVELVRPMDAARDARLLRACARLQYTVVYWSVCPWDWQARNVLQVQSRVSKQADTGGDIVMLGGASQMEQLSLPAAYHQSHPTPSQLMQHVVNGINTKRQSLATEASACTEPGPMQAVTVSRLLGHGVHMEVQ